MSQNAWLTVDSLPSAMKTIAFVVPDNQPLLAQLRGALLPLIYPENFEQFGTVTPEENSDYWRDIVLAFFEETPMFTPGMIMAFGQNVAVDGWLICDGATYMIADYPALFAVIQWVHGGYDELEDKFKVPDLRTRVVAGFHSGQSGFNSYGQKAGSVTHTLSVAELPAHSHTQNSHNHTQNTHGHVQDAHDHIAQATNEGQNSTSPNGRLMAVPTPGIYKSTATGIIPMSTNMIATATATNQNTVAVNQGTVAVNQNTGSGNAHSNLQPYMALNWLIKT